MDTGVGSARLIFNKKKDFLACDRRSRREAVFPSRSMLNVKISDVDPVLAKNRIQGLAPQTKRDFKNLI